MANHKLGIRGSAHQSERESLEPRTMYLWISDLELTVDRDYKEYQIDGIPNPEIKVDRVR